MDNHNKIDKDTGLLEMALDNNAAKSAADGLDQVCDNHSEQKMSKRWQLAYFYSTTASVFLVSIAG